MHCLKPSSQKQGTGAIEAEHGAGDLLRRALRRMRVVFDDGLPGRFGNGLRDIGDIRGSQLAGMVFLQIADHGARVRISILMTQRTGQMRRGGAADVRTRVSIGQREAPPPLW